jgi:hypothetical protein
VAGDVGDTADERLARRALQQGRILLDLNKLSADMFTRNNLTLSAVRILHRGNNDWLVVVVAFDWAAGKEVVSFIPMENTDRLGFQLKNAVAGTRWRDSKPLT